MLIKSREQVDIDPHEQYKQVTIKLWGQGVVLRDEVEGSSIAGAKRFVVRPKQFILSRIDARNGAFGLVPDFLDGAVVSNDFPAFTPNSSRLLPAFLGWMSKTRGFIDLCRAASEGTTNRVRLKENLFMSTKIPLPPLPEQRRIVARIEELAAKIEEARGLRRQAMEEAEVVWAASAQRLLFELDAQSVPLRKLVTVQGGGTPSKNDPALWNGDIPWVSPKDMKSREIRGSADYITETATLTSSAKLIDPGAVVIVVRGMILAHTVPSSVLRVRATINQDMKALLPNEDILPEYLCSAFWAMNRHVLELVERSSHDTRKLRTPSLLDFRLPIPSFPEQQRIVAYLDDLQSKVDSLKRLQAETSAELDALLPSVLDRAFKGKL